MAMTVRVYYHGDSGPWGYWTEAPVDEETAHDGFGEPPIHEIPVELWKAYKAASAAERDAEAAIDAYIEQEAK